MSTCAVIASACTPVSVRPAACRVTSSWVIARIASSIACCTEGPCACRCQPMNGRPSYSTISRKRVTPASRPPESTKPRSSSAVAMAPRPARWTRLGTIDPSPQAMVRPWSSTVPGSPLNIRNLGRKHLDSLAFIVEPGARDGVEGPYLALDLHGGLREIELRLVLCRSSARKWRARRAGGTAPTRCSSASTCVISAAPIGRQLRAQLARGLARDRRLATSRASARCRAPSPSA